MTYLNQPSWYRHYPRVVAVLVMAVLLAAPTCVTTAQAPKKPKDLTFDGIKFPMKKGDKFKRSMLTKKIEDLDGQRIRIRGYILPSFKQKGIKQFVLVRDNLECCFGPGAALYDCVVVKMLPGKTAEFSIRPVAVTGTFGIKELKGPDGNHLAVYSLIGESVR